MRFFYQLRWYFRREWKCYLGAISLLIVIAILQLIPPRIVGKLIDGIAKQQLNSDSVIMWIGIMVLIAVAIYLLRYLWRALLFGTSFQLAIELREKYYRQLSVQTPGFYLRYRTGDLMARATNDVDRVVYAAGDGVLTLVDSMVMGLAVLVVMSVQISWQLTLLSLLPLPFMSIAVKKQTARLNKHFSSAQAAFSSLNDQAQESLTSIRMIKSFGLENYQAQRFLATVQDAGAKNMDVARVDSLFNPIVQLSIVIANLLAIGGGGLMVMHGYLTLGQLTSFVMYLGLMIWPMLALAWMFNIVGRGSAAYERIQALLTKSPQISDGKQEVPVGRGRLKVDITRFNYIQNMVPTLHGVHFCLEPGQILGICGPTGAGKSVLLCLLQRQFDPDEGEICFHGISLRQLRLDSWRARLAVVSQSPFLFSESIAMNIAIGKPHASQQEIETAAKLACIHDDILRLPEGYKTEVGERGVMLSGGQKQRISIARALLMDAEILLLDDALSAVDGRTEYQILHNLRHWGQNRTLIISAHRLSALVSATEILVMRQGTVNQRGTHSQLVDMTGWYRDMYHFQQIEAELADSEVPLVTHGEGIS